MAITAEMLSELIDGTIAARRAVESRIKDLEKQASELARERDELLREEDGHRLALARLFPHAQVQHTPERPQDGQDSLFAVDEDLSRLSRADAVYGAVRALSADGALASPADIQTYLVDHNRSETRDQIGAALSYLRITDRVRRTGRGQWQTVAE